MKAMLAEGMTMDEVANRFGVSRQTVYNRLKADEIKNGAPKGITLKQTGHLQIDPETGLAVDMSGKDAIVVGRMGDERVTAFVRYHMEMMGMRQGCDKRNVPDLYQRFANYLQYCAEHGIIPNNMNAYYAIGVSKQDISFWKLGQAGTPEHKKFAEDITGFFASVHEQGVIDGMFNPISGIFWQKSHDGLIEASKLEVVNNDPLGEKKSAEDIAKAYEEVVLPD